MKTVLEPHRYLTNQSLGASFTSTPFECFAYYGMSIQFVVSAASSLNHSMTLEMSNDKINWAPVPSVDDFAENPVVVTVDGSTFLTYTTVIPYKWLRVVGVRTGGSGTLNVYISGVRV